MVEVNWGRMGVERCARVAYEAPEVHGCRKVVYSDICEIDMCVFGKVSQASAYPKLNNLGENGGKKKKRARASVPTT